MGPAKAMLNPKDMHWMNLVFLGNETMDTAIFAYGDDLVCGQLRSSMGFAAGSRLAEVLMAQTVSYQSAISCMLDVVGLSSEEKVPGVDAQLLIAAMENVESTRDGAVAQDPRLAMRPNEYAPSSANLSDKELAIAATVGSPHPQPTLGSVCLLHFAPESFHGGSIAYQG